MLLCRIWNPSILSKLDETGWDISTYPTLPLSLQIALFCGRSPRILRYFTMVSSGLTVEEGNTLDDIGHTRSLVDRLTD